MRHYIPAFYSRVEIMEGTTHVPDKRSCQTQASAERRGQAAIRPTAFNYPIDILGKLHENRYRFLQRYRSGFRQNPCRISWNSPISLLKAKRFVNSRSWLNSTSSRAAVKIEWASSRLIVATLMY